MHPAILQTFECAYFTEIHTSCLWDIRANLIESEFSVAGWVIRSRRMCEVTKELPVPNISVVL